jgi:hypothetical protein
MAKKAPKAPPASRGKSGSSWRGYFIGFFVGVVSTLLFFYFGGWDYFARQGDKVERRVRRGVDDAGERVGEKGGQAKERADEWIDSTFKK